MVRILHMQLGKLRPDKCQLYDCDGNITTITYIRNYTHQYTYIHKHARPHTNMHAHTQAHTQHTHTCTRTCVFISIILPMNIILLVSMVN